MSRIEVTIRPGDSDTFDDEPGAVTIVSNCPPELLRRLVTSLSERAHNTLDCCDRLFACWIGTWDNPALDHVVVRVEGKRYDLEGHCNNL